MLTYLLTSVEITFDRLQMAPQFQLLPHIFGHIRLGYETVDTARLCRLPKLKMAATKPEVQITFER